MILTRNSGNGFDSDKLRSVGTEYQWRNVLPLWNHQGQYFWKLLEENSWHVHKNLGYLISFVIYLCIGLVLGAWRGDKRYAEVMLMQLIMSTSLSKGVWGDETVTLSLPWLWQLCFTSAASADDTLWAINTSGQIVKCSTRFLFRRQDSSDPLLQRSTSVGSEEGDWELVWGIAYVAFNMMLPA